MVAGSHKKPRICLSTWGPRGTAGLVEEWESRRSNYEEHQQYRRRIKIPTNISSESADELEGT